MWKKFRLWLCKYMGWHKVTHFDGFDGCSAMATCAICGYRGLIDSQGNLF